MGLIERLSWALFRSEQVFVASSWPPIISRQVTECNGLQGCFGGSSFRFSGGWFLFHAQSSIPQRLHFGQHLGF